MVSLAKLLSWLDSYLHPRNFKVNVSSAYSQPINVEYSMLQGSYLGPVMYLVYASSLEEVITAPEPLLHLHQMTLKRNHQQQKKLTLTAMLMIRALRISLNQYVTMKQ